MRLKLTLNSFEGGDRVRKVISLKEERTTEGNVFVRGVRWYQFLTYKGTYSNIKSAFYLF